MNCVHIFGTGRHKRQADITLLFEYISEPCRIPYLNVSYIFRKFCLINFVFILYLTFAASLYDGKYACFHMGVVRSISRLIHGIARQIGVSN